MSGIMEIINSSLQGDRFMKRIIFLLLTFIVLTVLTSCGGQAHTHDLTDWSVVTYPDCKNTGLEKRTCTASDCDYEETRSLSALSHDRVEHGAKSATCTESGWNAYETCTRCDYTTYEEIPASHDTVPHGAKAATCTEIGWNAYETCTRCDYTTYEEIPASHDTVPHGAKAATCTEVGWNAYETCTRCDYTTYEEIPAGHDIASHGAKAATCTEAGWEAYEDCSRCDYTTYVEIEALDHDIKHHGAQAADCTNIGWEAYEDCTRCDYTTYEEIPASHDIVPHGAKSATCTEIGWKAYETCTRCDYTTYEEIPASHDTVPHEAKTATCTESGWKAYETCTRCDYTTYEEIPAGHDTVSHGAKAETCTEIGWNAYEACTRCDYTTYEEIPASHDIVPHGAKAATCTEIGWNAYETCTRCDYSTFEEIDKKGHTYELTFTKNETHHWYKSTCGCQDEVSGYGEHNFSLGKCSTCDYEEIDINESKYSKGLLYEVIPDTNTCKIAGIGSCTDSVIYIPKSIDGYRVVGIKSNAFYGNNTITAIIFPNSVTFIEDYAFCKCASLSYVLIPRSVTRILDKAFYNCDSLETLYYGGTESDWNNIYCAGYNYSLEAAQRYYYSSLEPKPDNHYWRYVAGEIAAWEFTAPTEELTYRVNADGVTCTITGIGDCTDIYIVIPDEIDGYKVTAIGSRVFGETNRKVYSVTLGRYVTTLEAEAFASCYSLAVVKLPEGIKTIGEAAFDNCTRLRTVNLPDSITTIGQRAFSCCYLLKSVTIPKGITVINYSVFHGCESITSIVIPDNVTKICGNAFWFCSALTDITLPDNIYISAGAFTMTGHYKDLSNWIGGVYFVDNYLIKAYDPMYDTQVNPGAYAADYVVPNGTRGIGEQAFYAPSGTYLTSVKIPATVGIIGNQAFHSCTQLTDLVIIGNGNTIIGDNAFESCDKLKTAVIGEGVTEIGRYAFNGCFALSKITLGADITTINSNAFNSLYYYGVTIYYESSRDDWKKIEIGERNSYMYSSTFYYYSNSEPTDVDYKYWHYVNGEIDIWPISRFSVGFLYELNNDLTTCTITGKGNCMDQDVVIPSKIDGFTVTAIGDYAFKYCNITSVTLPDTIISIGKEAFADCSLLSSINIPERVESIGATVFYNCESLKSIIIPTSVTYVANDVFAGCSSLTIYL